MTFFRTTNLCYQSTTGTASSYHTHTPEHQTHLRICTACGTLKCIQTTHDTCTSTVVVCHLYSSDPLPDGAEFEVVGDMPQLEEAKETPTTSGVKRRYGNNDLEDGTDVEVSQSKRVRRSIGEDEHGIKNALD